MQNLAHLNNEVPDATLMQLFFEMGMTEVPCILTIKLCEQFIICVGGIVQ